MPEPNDMPDTPPPVDGSLPTNFEGVNPDELLARGLQAAKMSGVGAYGWEPPTLAEVARLFPTYEVLAMHGRGGMGAVFKARQLALDRLVAIKLLPLEISVNQNFVDRFRREARAMARLNHPNIVSVHEFGQTSEGHLFIVMEFVEGANLAAIIQQVGLDPEQALSLAGQVCTALAYAHGKGIVHRDIKPANVIVNTESHVKVADFGLARLSDSSADELGHTVLGTVMGTPDYMAPEQKRGINVDHRADIYSLGVMLYEMLCRQVPHGIFAPPSQCIGCDERLDYIVIRAMQQQPELRYQSTTEMKADVETARTPPPLFAPASEFLPEDPHAAAPVRAKAKTLPYGVIAATLAVVAGAAVFWAKPWSSSERQPAVQSVKSSSLESTASKSAPTTPALSTKPMPATPHVPLLSLEDSVKRLMAHKGWEDIGSTGILDGTISLSIGDRNIPDLSPLAGMPVSELWTERNPITDLGPLRGLPLRTLFLDETPVSDVSPLKDLPLITLGLAGTQVSDLSPIRDLKLRRLFLNRNAQEIDLAPLAEMTTLEDILLPEHPKNLEALRKLPNLKYISYKWSGVTLKGSTNPAADFWRQYDAQQAAQALASAAAMTAPKDPPKPQSATGKWLAEQEPQWRAAFAEEVSAPFGKGVAGLKTQYTTALDPKLIAAAHAGRLDEVGAFRAELQRLASGADVPAVDEAATPIVLKLLRSSYRQSLTLLEAGRLTKAKAVLARYDAILAQSQALLTQRKLLDEAREIKTKREQLAAAWLKPQPASDPSNWKDALALVDTGKHIEDAESFWHRTANGIEWQPNDHSPSYAVTFHLPIALAPSYAVEVEFTCGAPDEDVGIGIPVEKGRMTTCWFRAEGYAGIGKVDGKDPQETLALGVSSLFRMEPGHRYIAVAEVRRAPDGVDIQFLVDGKTVGTYRGPTERLDLSSFWLIGSRRWIRLGSNRGVIFHRARVMPLEDLKRQGQTPPTPLYRPDNPLTAAWLKPPAFAAGNIIAAATKEHPFVNTLGMKFVPVPITSGATGGQRVLFGVWDTRVQDYEVFAKETKREWPKPDFAQGPTHPAVDVNWEDAQLFCQWLTGREQGVGRLPVGWNYRLPSDHEWSCAVGIGAREHAAMQPAEKNGKIIDVFPWGSYWPPRKGAGNYDSSLKVDEFQHTSPVGSFSENRFGLRDLGGNAWEWCEDLFDKEQKDRVVRGASWDNGDRGALPSSTRMHFAPGYWHDTIGFRCVLAPASTAK